MFERSRKYYLYSKPADMRKSFYTLSALVTTQMELDVMNGASYVFINRKRTHMKVLTWEGDGFSLYFKKLERGTFEHPDSENGYQISHEKLILILAGIETKKVKKRVRISL